MKWIKYQVLQNTIGDEKIFITKKVGHSDANLVIAQNEAYNGQYTIEEDATPENPIAAAIPMVESTEYSGCFYRMVNGEKEWLNPPMRQGVEYRTMESYNGDVVFTKLINIWGDSQTIQMDDDVYNVFSCTGTYHGETDNIHKFSGSDYGKFIAEYNFVNKKLTISANGTAYGVDEIYAVIKYVKYSASRF